MTEIDTALDILTAQWLRREIDRRALSVADLTDRAGLSPYTLYNWLAGRSTMKIDTFRSILFTLKSHDERR